jgi:hypothetical protein
MHPARGLSGPATVLFLVVGAGRATQVERDLALIAPDAFRTSLRLRSATWTPLQPGSTAVTAGARLLRTTEDELRPHRQLSTSQADTLRRTVEEQCLP